MASQYAAELCALLVEDNFGELFARIFSTLTRYDRLNLPRLKFHSGLSNRQLLPALAAMIQQHLVYHYTSYDDGVTYYEANLQSAYYLVRAGKILEFVEERLGKYAATVMSSIMYLGHAQVSHLENLPELQPEQSHTNGVDKEHDEVDGDEEQPNGLSGDHSDQQPALLHPTLKVLAAHGYIIRVREAQFQSHADNILDAERVLKSRPEIKAMKGKRMEEAVIEGTLELLKERTDGDLTRGLMVQGVPRGAKRKHGSKSADAPNKKARVDFASVDEDDEQDEEENEWSDDEMGYDTTPMESGLVVRVNYNKLDVALRNCRFIQIAEQDASPATAEVYECLLRRIEYQTHQCRDTVEIPREGEEGEQYSVPIALSAVAEDVDPRLDLSGSIGPMEISQPDNRRGKRPLEDDVNGTNHEGANGLSSGGNRTFEVDQHLCLLAQPPHNLTSKRIVSGLITWTVEFRHLARKLRHLELERMIEARYGDVALRVVRVLHAKGKLDEKRLQEISLLPFKDLRQVLASMQAGGFVDLQEVPRDAQRQPSRTIYLWYYDPDRICNSVLQDTYKAMSRCFQRLRFERNRLKEFLEKTERSDVKGNEERYLSEGELALLQQWKAKEALLIGEVARLDEMVAVMRDY
ncbi:putative DNA directed RNA polymerase III subunit Rpc82 [Aspergillus clavatus NRRL 1]|uniref:DNA-directed RNA polymerase III subunit rpc3 n=1 Tax=Aspergillus clavatus (strain ATCC 1007 / CBS 513.65 / DSM 816 / NCTC 3887 / NRRL 1 / QM 1276 / 107) TaxID=344612 RepID=RPC3_ASPCL|nr:DNA directed RNA polymerase III subunit Rpc82, putative [Aspergillus clavatus NRRL 1]A1C4R7.1 RecName: Full=DNA-directed RNA polymerase III subunit rpc3; Short=RNA polymerase III subunit C3 [Aspergillus clavatus NRRL 1]EAW14685.1 DNA directed RNA polymerase III subunit Rpc82, putative [Aspergillus clavatus NRRL 1]